LNSPKIRLFLSIIKLTSLNKHVTIQQLVDELGIQLKYHVSALKNRLKELGNEGYMDIDIESITASKRQRTNLALLAVREGADIENVCNVLGWKEFENIVYEILNFNGFYVKRNLVFRSAKRKYEIDVLGLKEDLILSIDCKHWKKSWQRTAIKKSVKAQIDRTMALTKLWPKLRGKLNIFLLEGMEVLPIIVTLFETPIKIFKNVPIVPIFYFQNFLNALHTRIEELKTFKVEN
jgi:hypothetical protein